MKAMTRRLSPFKFSRRFCTMGNPSALVVSAYGSDIFSPECFVHGCVCHHINGPTRRHTHTYARVTSRPSVLSKANIVLHRWDDGRFPRFFFGLWHHLLTLVSSQRRPPPTTSIFNQSLRIDIHYNCIAMTDVWVVLG